MSVVIPVVDEAGRIARCLRAVLDQEWPADRLEILIVDGAPGDGTGEVAREVLGDAGHRLAAVIANPGGGRSENLNVGLRRAQGEILCRVDARSVIPPHYVRSCVDALEDAATAVIGGMQTAVAATTRAHERGICRGLTNPFAMGGARYRRSTTAVDADTVYLGAFRREDLLAVGGWDEALGANEDFDLNTRMRTSTGRVRFDPALRVAYQPRDTLRAVAAQYWSFGRWKGRYLRHRNERPKPRQMVGLAVAPATVLFLAAVTAGWPLRRSVLAATAVVALAAIDHVGAAPDDQRAPLATRGWAAATAITVASSWSAGLWYEILSGHRRA